MITFAWKLIPALSNALYELIPASIGASLIAVAVSSFTEAPSDAGTILDAIAAWYHRGRKRSRTFSLLDIFTFRF